MIPTSTAVRRRLALLAQQRPALDDNRQQQQEGSTDFQWVQDAGGRVATGASAFARPGLARLPSHRMPARAPVIGSLDDFHREHPTAAARSGAADRPHEVHAMLDLVVQQA